MITSNPLSSCCNAPVKLELFDSSGSKKFVCTVCGKMCSFEQGTVNASAVEELRKEFRAAFWSSENGMDVDEIFDWFLAHASTLSDSTLREVLEQERQFVLNILDGVDLADEQMGNKGGGTKAIRLALASRPVSIITKRLEKKI